jgi:hypothetical protein
MMVIEQLPGVLDVSRLAVREEIGLRRLQQRKHA